MCDTPCARSPIWVVFKVFDPSTSVFTCIPPVISHEMQSCEQKKSNSSIWDLCGRISSAYDIEVPATRRVDERQVEKKRWWDERDRLSRTDSFVNRRSILMTRDDWTEKNASPPFTASQDHHLKPHNWISLGYITWLKLKVRIYQVWRLKKKRKKSLSKFVSAFLLKFIIMN